MRSNKVLRLLSLFSFSLCGVSDTYAAAGDNTSAVTNFMIGFTVFMIILTLWLVLVYSEKNDEEGSLIKSPISKLRQLLTASTPIENEKDILLDHDYDGIRELDSRIPPWFHALLWGTVIFAAVYMIRFHIIGSGNVQAEEYLAEVQQAGMQRQILIKTGAFLNEETVTQLTDAAALQTGKDIFIKNCATCHGNNGEGLVGPNFTDKYWIHGGDIKDLFTTIKYGVPSKGMISWSAQLGPNQIQEVASYILSLQGTNPPNPKEPEGTLYEPESETE